MNYRQVDMWSFIYDYYSCIVKENCSRAGQRALFTNSVNNCSLNYIQLVNTSNNTFWTLIQLNSSNLKHNSNTVSILLSRYSVIGSILMIVNYSSI